MNEGLMLMVVGMGTVFLFLLIMVAVITIASKVLAPYAKVLDAPKPAAKKKAPKKAAAPAEDGEIVAAISAAVAKHRAANKS